MQRPLILLASLTLALVIGCGDDPNGGNDSTNNATNNGSNNDANNTTGATNNDVQPVVRGWGEACDPDAEVCAGELACVNTGHIDQEDRWLCSTKCSITSRECLGEGWCVPVEAREDYCASLDDPRHSEERECDTGEECEGQTICVEINARGDKQCRLPCTVDIPGDGIDAPRSTGCLTQTKICEPFGDSVHVCG